MKGYKRHRGLRRYYLNLTTKNDFDDMFFDFSNSDSWPDDWHTHFDWKGFGNDSFNRRKPHLDKLFRHFNLIVEKTKDINQQFQLYIILLDYDSSSDALFFHTPDPNNSKLLFKPSDLKITSTLKNELLSKYIDNLIGFEKRYGEADEAFCLIYKQNIGPQIL